MQNLNFYFKKNATVTLTAGIFLLLIFIDQFAKHYAKNLFFNKEFAFSLPVPIIVIYVIYLIVLAAIIYYISGHYKNFSPVVKFAWILILAGAMSNISERVILGSVRDFIYISLSKWTGIYNLADGYIILGIIILLFSSNNKISAV